MERTPRASIVRQLVGLAAPVAGMNVLNVLALAIDTAMLGRLDGAETLLTGLGFATQLVFLLMVLMMGLAVGAVALVARAHGAGDHARVNHVLLQSTMLTVLLGAAIGVAGNIFAPSLLMALGASAEAALSGLAYLRPLLASTVFLYLMTLYGAVMRGIGNTRIPFLVAVLATVINVVLDAVLIYGALGLPALGIQGAALGTAASHLVATLVLGWCLRRGMAGGLRLPLRPRAIAPATARALLRIGAPAALDMFLIEAGFLAMIAMLGHVDGAAVAAHTIGVRIQALAFVPGLGISQATAALAGQALGAGDVEQARRILRASLLLAMALLGLLAVTAVLGVYPILSIFDVPAGSTLEAHAVVWIRILGVCMPVAGWYIVLVGFLQGAGATGTALRINLHAVVLCQVPAGVVLGVALDLGALGVWLSFPLSFVLRVTLGVRAYRRGAWARVGVHT